MDFYTSKFSGYIDNCKVLDYAVYIEKKQGFAKINPFSSYTQFVIYITDKGNYCLTLDGFGEFSHPERGGFELTLDGKVVRYKDKIYKFSRKYKNGKFATLREFAEAMSL